MEFEKGDLVRLSDFGKLVAGDRGSNVGIVVAGPYDLLAPTSGEVTSYYIAYDVLVDDEVIERVPVDFLKRMVSDERDIERMETVVRRNKTD